MVLSKKFRYTISDVCNVSLILIVLFLYSCGNESDELCYKISYDKNATLAKSDIVFITEIDGQNCLKDSLRQKMENIHSIDIQWPKDSLNYIYFSNGRGEYISAKQVIVSYVDTLGDAAKVELDFYFYANCKCRIESVKVLSNTSKRSNVDKNRPVISKSNKRLSTSEKKSELETPEQKRQRRFKEARAARKPKSIEDLFDRSKEEN